MDIPDTLAAARRRAGLTQVELAERAGTAQAAVSAYESGRKQPSAAMFIRLLAAAGTQLEAVDASPIQTPSPVERARRGRVLEQVIGLAEALPARQSRRLRYPVLKDHGRTGPA